MTKNKIKYHSKYGLSHSSPWSLIRKSLGLLLSDFSNALLTSYVTPFFFFQKILPKTLWFQFLSICVNFPKCSLHFLSTPIMSDQRIKFVMWQPSILESVWTPLSVHRSTHIKINMVGSLILFTMKQMSNLHYGRLNPPFLIHENSIQPHLKKIVYRWMMKQECDSHWICLWSLTT